MLLAATLPLFFAGCTQKELVDIPVDPTPRENSVVIRDSLYAIEQLLCGAITIEYPDENFNVVATEEGIAIRVMTTGASITADIPQRLTGSRIDITSRDPSPDPEGIYYTFYLSARGEERLYCRVMSWDTSPNPFGGWFSVHAGETPDEWVFEWEVTETTAGNETAIVSTGYLAGTFDPIRTP